MWSRDKKVLAVDDNPINLEILNECLGDRYLIKFAQTGEEALQIAEHFQPGIVLLDVMMPQMDGLDVCRRVRSMPGMHDCVIIMVSAKAMPSEQSAGLRAGADDYITKPFDDAELMDTIRRHTSSGKLDNDILSADDLQERFGWSPRVALRDAL